MILTKEEADCIEHWLSQIADYLGIYPDKQSSRELAIYSLGRLDETVQNAVIRSNKDEK